MCADGAVRRADTPPAHTVSRPAPRAVPGRRHHLRGGTPQLGRDHDVAQPDPLQRDADGPGHGAHALADVVGGGRPRGEQVLERADGDRLAQRHLDGGVDQRVGVLDRLVPQPGVRRPAGHDEADLDRQPVGGEHLLPGHDDQPRADADADEPLPPPAPAVPAGAEHLGEAAVPVHQDPLTPGAGAPPARDRPARGRGTGGGRARRRRPPGSLLAAHRTASGVEPGAS
jgi:hypothetical protein